MCNHWLLFLFIISPCPCWFQIFTIVQSVVGLAWLIALHFNVRRYLARLAEVAKSTQEGLGKPTGVRTSAGWWSTSRPVARPSPTDVPSRLCILKLKLSCVHFLLILDRTVFMQAIKRDVTSR